MGTPPGYHLDRGFGSGANNWLIHLEGGGWCNNIRTCVFRKTTRRGSSKFMEKQVNFTGILSNKAEQNPDFYNWNRVKLRYCDGASFAGEGYNERTKDLVSCYGRINGQGNATCEAGSSFWMLSWGSSIHFTL